MRTLTLLAGAIALASLTLGYVRKVKMADGDKPVIKKAKVRYAGNSMLMMGYVTAAFIFISRVLY